jgi:hypothetical protein
MTPAQKNFAWAAGALAFGLAANHYHLLERRWYGAFAVAAIYLGLGIRDMVQGRK